MIWCRLRGVSRPKLAMEQDLKASALKASDEDVDASLSRYYEAIANFDEPGKKKEASTTLTKLLELLERHGSDAAARMQANGAAAADAQGPSCASGPSGPSFSKMVFRVERMLCKNGTTAKKDQVDKLKRLLLLSESGGAPALLRGKVSDQLFRSALDALDRCPARFETKISASPHAEWVGVLELLCRQPLYVRRLPLADLVQLLNSCCLWICGEENELGERCGPHASIACQPQLMRGYGQLLQQLVLHWRRDMLVVGAGDDMGPLATLFEFFGEVVTLPRAHLEHLLVTIWQALLRALLSHGLNATQELAGFGLQHQLQEHVRFAWRQSQALHEQLVPFLRLHLASLRVCGLALPASPLRQLFLLLQNEVATGAALAGGGALLSTTEIGDKAWRARSLLQLAAEVYLLQHAAPPAAPPAAPAEPPAKRHKAAQGAERPGAERPGALLLAKLEAATGERAEEAPRWLLLAGTLCAREPGWLDDAERRVWAEALLRRLPAREAGGGQLERLLPLPWCVQGVASGATVGSAAPVWLRLWDTLLALAAGRATPHHAQATPGASALGAFARREAQGFVQLCVGALATLLRRRLLPRQQVAAAARAAATSALFAPSAPPAPPAPAGGDARPRPQDASAPAGRGGGGAMGGAPTHGLLAPLIDLGMQIARTAGNAGDGDGGDDGGGVGSRSEGAEAEAGAEERAALLRWLLSAVHAPLVRPAFEGTAPWACAAQLGHEAVQRREEAHGEAVCAAVARLVCGGAEAEVEEGAKEAVEAGTRLAGLTRLATGWSGGAAGWDGEDEATAGEGEVGGSGEGGWWQGEGGWWAGEGGWWEGEARRAPPALVQLELHLQQLDAAVPPSSGAAPQQAARGASPREHAAGGTPLAVHAPPSVLLPLAAQLLRAQAEALQRPAGFRAALSAEARPSGWEGAAHAARLARLVARVLVAAGSECAPQQLVQTLQKALRLLREHMAAASAAAAAEANATEANADAATPGRWSGAAGAMCGLRGCLLALEPTCTSAAWRRDQGDEWPEPVLAPLNAELAGLVRSLKPLCTAARSASAAQAQRAAGGPAPTVGSARQHDDMDDDMDDDMAAGDEDAGPMGGAEPHGGAAARRAEAAGGAGAEGEPLEALRATLRCLQVWLRVASDPAAKVYASLRESLAGVRGAPPRVHELGLHCMAAACRAHAAAVPAGGGGSAPDDAAQQRALQAAEEWAALAEPLLKPAARGRIAGRLGEAELCSELHRAACFASGAPDSLPLGGSSVELKAYSRLLAQALGECRVRGSFGLVTRDVRLLQPLLPRTRLLLVTALHEHLLLRVRLLRQSLQARGREHFSDGSELDALVELDDGNGEDELVEALRDPQWAVRARAAAAVRALFDSSGEEDQAGLLQERGAHTALVPLCSTTHAAAPSKPVVTPHPSHHPPTLTPLSLPPPHPHPLDLGWPIVRSGYCTRRCKRRSGLARRTRPRDSPCTPCAPSASEPRRHPLRGTTARTSASRRATSLQTWR